MPGPRSFRDRWTSARRSESRRKRSYCSSSSRTAARALPGAAPTPCHQSVFGLDLVTLAALHGRPSSELFPAAVASGGESFALASKLGNKGPWGQQLSRLTTGSMTRWRRPRNWNCVGSSIGGTSGTTMELWFDWAKMADCDCRDACSSKLDWLDPKWNGTPKEKGTPFSLTD